MKQSLLSLCALAFTLSLHAGDPVKNPKSPVTPVVNDAHYLGSLNFGVKTTDSYTDGHFSIVAPLWSNLGSDGLIKGTIVYLEPYTSWGEGGEVASSIGLGARHLFGNQPWSALRDQSQRPVGFMQEGLMIGASVFLDMLDTETNHQFWQIGVGAEIATRYIELSGNYYIPITDAHEVERRRTRETFTSTRTSTHTVDTSGAPFATQNTVQQDVGLTTYATTTTTTTTVERLFRRFEEGMEGWDADLGIMLPYVDKYCEVWLRGGYYSFDNQPFGPQQGGTGNVEGFKAGIELRPVPAVALSATWYEDERLVGDEWLFGVRFHLPFETADLADGKGGFWGHIKHAFQPRSRHLAERMAEPVRRQNAAVKTASTVKEDKPKVSSSARRVTRVVSQSSERVVLAEDIIFVNDGPDAGNGIAQSGTVETGTAEQPFNTIQEGATLASTRSNDSGNVWSVYTQGGGPDYVEGVSITETVGVNFVTSAIPIQGMNGQTFGTGHMPRVVGGFEAIFAGFLGVSGYEITGGFKGDAIYAEAVDEVSITSNVINATDPHGIHLYGAEDDFMIATIAGNTIQNVIAGMDSGPVGQGLIIEGFDIASMLVGVFDNTFLNNDGDDIRVEGMDGSLITLVADGNSFIGGDNDGVEAHAHDESGVALIFSNNTFLGKGDDGIDAYSDGIGDLYAQIVGNTFEDITEDAIQFEAYEGGTAGDLVSGFPLLIQDNIIRNTGENGIQLESYDASLLDALITGNTITGTTLSGIYAYTEGEAIMGVIAETNIFQDIGGAAIYFEADGAAGNYLLGEVIGNTFTNTGDGVYSTISGATSTNLSVRDNVFTTAAYSHVYARTNDSSELLMEISGNTMSGSVLDAVSLETTGTSSSDVTLDNNTITNTLANGVYLSEAVGSTLTVNGTISNSISLEALNKLTVNGTSPAGTLIINGAPVVLPVDVP
jgi:hypothetical protein